MKKVSIPLGKQENYILFGFLTLKDGTDKFPRNVGKKLLLFLA